MPFLPTRLQSISPGARILTHIFVYFLCLMLGFFLVKTICRNYSFPSAMSSMWMLFLCFSLKKKKHKKCAAICCCTLMRFTHIFTCTGVHRCSWRLSCSQWTLWIFWGKYRLSQSFCSETHIMNGLKQLSNRVRLGFRCSTICFCNKMGFKAPRMCLIFFSPACVILTSAPSCHSRVCHWLCFWQPVLKFWFVMLFSVAALLVSETG